MSPRDRKPKLFESDYDEMKPSFEDRQPSRASNAKRIQKIHPIGPRVVVRVRRDATMTDSGLYLPEGSKQIMQDSVVAEVIEVASALDSSTEEVTNVSGIPLGATVLIPTTAGVKVPWDEELRVVDVREILALIDEISVV